MKKKVWGKPKIWNLGVEKTEVCGKGKDKHPNWVWCDLHQRMHPKNHQKHDFCS